MTSVYGDLILQDGAKVIDKSGTEIINSWEFFNLTLGVYLIPNIYLKEDPSLDVYKKTIPVSNCIVKKIGKSITIYIPPFSIKPITTGFNTEAITSLVIKGIPNSLKNTSVVNGGCAFVHPNGETFTFTRAYFQYDGTIPNVMDLIIEKKDILGGWGSAFYPNTAKTNGLCINYNLN
ncbi:hypothetical protein ACTFIY_004577 [Dictyostelium cf. discoideum]